MDDQKLRKLRTNRGEPGRMRESSNFLVFGAIYIDKGGGSKAGI